MRIILAMFFICGFLLASWSTQSLITSPSADETRRERARVAGWPSVSGTLHEIRLRESKVGIKGAPYYYATARYEYSVDGIEYEGDRIGPSEYVEAYRDKHPPALEMRLSRFFSPANLVKREVTDNGLPIWNEEIIILRFTDQPVTVYYDPAKPASSLLDPRDPESVTTTSTLLPYLIMLPLGLFMMAVSVFIYWLSIKGPESSVSHPSRAVVPRGPQFQKVFPHGFSDMDWRGHDDIPLPASDLGEQREPARKLVIADTQAGSRTIAAGTYVWVLGTPAGGHVLVELQDERFEVPAANLVDTPVRPPTDRLVRLDPCFSSPRSMVQVYVDKVDLFAILECRHGNLFLEDTVPGVGTYSRLIFIGRLPRDAKAYRSFWESHRTLSDDELHLRGIGTVM
jgi:hypothetical protein